MLTTLARVKVQAGIASAVTAYDAELLQWIGVASMIARNETDRYLGGLIHGYTIASPTVVTSYGHGLQSGDTVNIRNSNGTSINGARVVTVTGPDTFTVPVNVTVVGSAGNYVRDYVEYYDAPAARDFQLNEWPLLSLTEIKLDTVGGYGQVADSFDADTALESGVDYALQIGRAGRNTGWVLSRFGNWSSAFSRYAGNLAGKPCSIEGAIKASYTAGYDPIPSDLMDAVGVCVMGLRSAKGKGGPFTSESYDYYSYSLGNASERAAVLGSAESTFQRYRRLAIFG